MQTESEGTSRRQLLAPYLDLLSRVGGADADPAAPVVIGELELELDRWDRIAIAEFETTTHAWRRLLAETAALQAKLSQDLAKLKQGDNGSPEGAQAEVQTDAAVGFALMTELQHEVDRMVGSGDLSQAKQLSTTRNRLSRNVAALKDVIGDPALEKAESLAEDWRLQPDETVRALGGRDAPSAQSIESLLALEEELVRKQKQAEEPTQTETVVPAHFKLQEPRRQLAGPLAIVLAVLGAVWAVFVLMPSLNRVEYRQFEAADFAGLPAVSQVVSRAPSLFIRVDGKAWTELPQRDRDDVMRTLSAAAEAEGYSGVHVSTVNGRPVAQWLQKTGVKFLPPTP